MANKIKYPVIDGEKECGVCGEWKPISAYCKARKHYTSQCKTCKNQYAAKYRSKPENKQKSAEYAKEYIKNPSNRDRKNTYLRQYRKGEKAKLTKNTWRKEWTARENQKAVEYKGGKCSICGYVRCLAALDFHHKNPKEKDGYGTGALKAHWTFERNKKEIDKCVLVCVRCHREIHAGVISI
jgi:5-methylcytosine-specific restriction endonuclease McrA